MGTCERYDVENAGGRLITGSVCLTFIVLRLLVDVRQIHPRWSRKHDW